jgi:transposase
MIHYLGIDVSCRTLEVSDAPGTLSGQFANTPKGVASLLGWVHRHVSEGAHVVLEPTSTYHHLLVEVLNQKQVPYTLVNPANTAAFATVQGKRAKTDRGDALLLAAFGDSQMPQSTPPPDQDQERVKSLRRHLVWLEREARSARNRLETARRSPWTLPEVLESLERTATALEEEAAQVARVLQARVATHPRWQQEIALLTTVPGIGVKTAILLLSELPARARCRSAKAWVAFCGVNPEPRESGTSRYSRLSRRGSPQVRAGLYMAAVSAMRWNPAVQALCQRLRAKGKSGRVRVMAAMNKLLHLCYGVLRTGTPFDRTLHQPLTP